MHAKAVAGNPHGKWKFGYRRVYDEHTRELLRQEINEDEAWIVREIVQRCLEGEPTSRIADDLNRREVPTPEMFRRERLGLEYQQYKWVRTQIRRIAIDPYYASQRVHHGQVVADGTWPRLVADRDHEVLVAKLNDPTRRTTRDYTPKHLLVGIALCGFVFDDGQVCDARMHRIKNRGCPSYICSVRYHVSRQQAKSDAFVEETILRRFERSDAAQLFAPPENGEEYQLADELRTLEARLESFADQAADGSISPDSLARIEAKLQPRIRELREQLRPKTVSSEVTELLQANSPRELWDRWPLHKKRAAIRAVCTVRILPKVPGSDVKKWDPSRITFTWH
nr:recombinase family protein [Haloechinothrix aidingensis]